MGMIRRIAALALGIAVMLFLAPDICARSAMSEYIEGKFRYMPANSANSVTRNYFYSDDYFGASGKNTDPHLRTMSLDLALSAFGSDYGRPFSENTVNLLRGIGFTDLAVKETDETPAEDTVGSVIAHKKTRYGEVTAVTVRGSAYGYEWLNSIDSGTSGNAAGFDAAAKKLLDRLKAYLEKNRLRSTKLWIVGYSRAGAICELAGKYINEHLKEFGTSADDLYVYTFEAPAASSVYSEYANIHSVMNPNDIVPLVYPEVWGLYHTGVPEPLDCEDITIYRKELSYSFSDGFSLVNRKQYIYDEKTLQLKEVVIDPPVSMAEFEREFIDWLGVRLSRLTYAQNSGYVGDLISVVLSRRLSGRPELEGYLREAFIAAFSMENVADILPLIYSKPGSPEYEAALDAFSELINGRIKSDDPADAFTDEEYARVRRAIPALLKALAPAASSDIDGTHIFGYFSTFLGNLNNIVSQHSDIIVLDLTENMDSYHTGAERVPEVTTTTTTTTTTTATEMSTTVRETTTAAETADSDSETTVEPETDSAEETEPVGEDEKSGGNDRLLWIFIISGAAGAVILATVIILIIKNKR